MQDHLGDFMIPHQLRQVESDSHLQHSQSVDDIGTCQCGKNAGHGLLEPSLGVGQLAVALAAGHKAGQTVVAVDPRYFRPTEVETLLGDPSKAKQQMGWEPKVSFQDLLTGYPHINNSALSLRF